MESAEPDPSQSQPSEEEIRKYAEQLRILPVDGVVSDTVMSLLSCAQAKLGRHDARLLIDLASICLDHARAYLPQEAVTQTDSVLGQLRMAQVEAEREVSSAGPQENDLDRVPAPPGRTTTSGSTAGQQPSGSDAQSPSGGGRLWVPGR